MADNFLSPTNCSIFLNDPGIDDLGIIEPDCNDDPGIGEPDCLDNPGVVEPDCLDDDDDDDDDDDVRAFATLTAIVWSGLVCDRSMV